MGIERTRQKMREASVIIYMFDLSVENPESISQQVSELEQLEIPFIKAGNKTDIASPALLKTLKDQPGFVFISAKLKDNLDKLKKRLIDLLDLGKVRVGDTIVTNARHYESLFKSQTALREVIDGMEKQASGELLAEDIRQSIYYLGEITGEITNEDLLENIFSKFCIGK
jgi:tRNA modification GTPase